MFKILQLFKNKIINTINCFAGLLKKMTILKDDVTSNHQKSFYINATGRQLKRKNTNLDQDTPKKFLLADMLIGHRNVDHSNGDIQSQSPVAALSNMGNTCFLNSVLYSLRFAPTFLHNLHHLIEDLNTVNTRLNQNKIKSSSLGRNISSLSGPSSRSTSSKDLLSLGSNNDIIPKTKVQVVTEKLHELFSVMHNMENNDSKDSYQPNALLSAVQSANSIFQGNHQQDAHELLVYLLDNIRETCESLAQQVKHYPELLVEKENNTNTTSNNTKFWAIHKPWRKSSKKNDNAVKDSINEEKINGACVYESEEYNSSESNEENGRKKIGYNFVCEDFEGITLRRTKCLECECVTERKEPFYDIPVPINVKEDDTNLHANEIYRRACVTSEKLCDSNKYLCDNCNHYNEATREVSFEKLPNIMVLQLKRFMTTLTGVQKVNTYFPTPLQLACFCETCCKTEDDNPIHTYHLCCVIMHLGGNMASGHYIAYVRASDVTNDYAECPHDLPKSSLSASSSEKSINLLKSLKNLKPRSLTNALNDYKNDTNKPSTTGFRLCKSLLCCGVKLNKNILENVVNTYNRRNEDVWLECDDDTIHPISSTEFQSLLAHKPNSTATPYLLFYTKKSIPEE